MATINLAHERFIQEMILHGDKTRAYLAAYPNCKPSSAYKSACRLLKNTRVRERIRKSVVYAQQKAERKLEHKFNEEVLARLDKRKELALIVRQQLKTTKTVVCYGKELTYEVGPTHAELLRAIDLDWKLSQGWKRESEGYEL